jgi:hypothetical protein
MARTRCHFWQDDGSVDFEFGPLYEEIPDDLITAYKAAEAARTAARRALLNHVEGLTPIKSNAECNAEDDGPVATGKTKKVGKR